MTPKIIALTRTPSPKLVSCQLTYVSRTDIDIARALRQHQDYCQLLQHCGAQLVTLPAADDLADGVFVEDTALVLDDVAVLLRMGTPSREPETALMKKQLHRWRHKVLSLEEPCRLEGGDILRVGKQLFVGHTSRSNEQGIEALASVLQPYGYRVTAVPVSGCLHLKTGVTAVDENTMLLNPDWISPSAFSGFRCLSVADGEPFAANIIRLGEVIIMAAGHTATRRQLQKHGYQVVTVAIDELMKAEAGLTCMSIIFNEGG